MSRNGWRPGAATTYVISRNGRRPDVAPYQACHISAMTGAGSRALAADTGHMANILRRGRKVGCITVPGGCAAAPNRVALQGYAGRGIVAHPIPHGSARKTARPQEIPCHSRARPGAAHGDAGRAAGIHIPRNTAPGVSGKPRRRRHTVQSMLPVMSSTLHVRAAGGVRAHGYALPDRLDGFRFECGGRHTMLASPPYSTRFTRSLERRYEVLSMQDPAVCVVQVFRTNHTIGRRVAAAAAPAGDIGPERAGSAQCCQTERGRLRMAF